MIVDYPYADRVLLVDLSNLAYISYFGLKDMTTRVGRPSGHVYGFFEKIKGMMDWDEKIGLVFAIDHFPEWKQKILPTYKDNRNHPDFNPKPDCQQLVGYFRATTIWEKGNEADDVIASFCKQVDGHPKMTVDIISTDKDLYQLLGQKNVRIFNPIKNTYVQIADRDKAFGVDSWDKIALWKAIFGDSSDNIKAGAPRVRKVDVIPMIDESDGTVESFYEIYESKRNGLTKKSQEKFDQGKDTIEKNFKIVKLRKELRYEESPKQGNLRFLSSFLNKFECLSLQESAPIMVGN